MPRRRYSREFKESAVKLVYEQGYAPSEAAKSLGIDPATLRFWLKKNPPPVQGAAHRSTPAPWLTSRGFYAPTTD
jgi:transposase-like protein